MTKCPCEDCLVLAICKSKSSIRCSILREAFSRADYKNEKITDFWLTVHKLLPHAAMVHYD